VVSVFPLRTKNWVEPSIYGGAGPRLIVSAIMNTQQFFEKVLPTQGNICVVGIKDQQVRPKFFGYLEEALEQITLFDRDDFNTFFAVGTFDGYQRKASACIFMRSFFVDIDCGPDKPYAEWETGLSELQKFATSNGLPQPIIVDSGRGIHGYWTFTENIPADKWKPYAEKFKDFCISRGFKIDEVVTADAARILRAPGTRNLKGEAIPVLIHQDGDGPTEFGMWVEILGEVEQKFDLSQVKHGLDEETKALFDKMNGNYEYVFEKLAIASLEGNGCEQIRHILINAADCPEPLWYAGISVAARCVDGATAIHKLSEDYPGYSHTETERKAAQSLREASWAHSCDAFERENSAGCQGCPHRGRFGKAGPIMLARSIKLAQPGNQSDSESSDGGGGEAPQEEDAVRPNQNAQGLVTFPDFIQPYFRPVNGGVYYQPAPRITKDGKKIPQDAEMLVPNDLYPTQRLFSPHDGECLVMKLVLPHDKDREFLLPLKDVTAQDRLKAILASNSVTFEPANGARLASYLMKWASYLVQTQRADIMRIQQGWTEDHESFVLGTSEIFANEIRHCPPSPAAKNLVRNIKPVGDFDVWRKCAQMLNDPGYEYHAFTLLCGFATPLMEFTNVNGIVLSLFGDSGAGKTGALYSAMSIWGAPENMTVNDATPNALTQRMITSKNITFGLDEQTNLDGKVASDVVYKTSAGRPKIRLMSSANQEREAEFITRLIAIVTTNNSLIDIISTYKANTTAEEMRILEPRLTKPNVPGYELTLERGMEMFEPYKTNYGHAGVPYIQELLRIGKEELMRRIKIEFMHVSDKYTDSGEYRYIANLLVGVMVAERIVREMGMLNFDIDRIMRVMGAKFREVIHSKYKADSDTREDVLGDFINKNIQNMLVIRDGKATVTPRGPLVIRAEADTSTIYISTSALKQYLLEVRLGVKDFEGRMSNAGILQGKVRKQMAAGWNEAVGSTNVQAYTITTDISHLFPAVEEKTDGKEAAPTASSTEQ